jgi:thymidylate synthase
MAKIDKTFADVCRKILEQGKEYENKRRGVKRLQITSYTFRHDFKDGFPALTNKKLYWKGIVGELIWFLRSDNNVKYLNDNGITIWNADAYNWHKKITENPLTQEEFNKLGSGSVGRNYSKQWRDFNGIDQIQNLVDDMKADIMGSRLIVSAWNPSELDQTALPPCHNYFQIIGVPMGNDEYGFELHWLQRSVDTFLGLPFNIASYALLAKILEKITGYKALAIEGNLKCVHFYDNQYDAVKLLLDRNTNTHSNCEVEINNIDFNSDVNTIFNQMNIKDFNLVGYSSDSELKVDMLAPLK